MNSAALLLAALLLAAFLSRAAAAPEGNIPNKWRYHLGNPTPPDQMRDLSTDRPDATESPYTVDAGHFQVESSLVDYSLDREPGTRSDEWTFGSINLKVGLLNNIDAQFICDSYIDESTKQGGLRQSASGFSDITARVKVNLWGNDGGATALALMPFVKIPTATAVASDEWQGGIILPFAMELAAGVGLGLMAEVDFVHDEASGSYATEWVHTATVGIDLTERLGAFVEFIGVAGTAQTHHYQAGCNVGLTFGVTRDIQADAGVRIGLNRAAEDFGVFTGLSVRF